MNFRCTAQSEHMKIQLKTENSIFSSFIEIFWFFSTNFLFTIWELIFQSFWFDFPNDRSSVSEFRAEALYMGLGWTLHCSYGIVMISLYLYFDAVDFFVLNSWKPQTNCSTPINATSIMYLPQIWSNHNTLFTNIFEKIVYTESCVQLYSSTLDTFFSSSLSFYGKIDWDILLKLCTKCHQVLWCEIAQ